MKGVPGAECPLRTNSKRIQHGRIALRKEHGLVQVVAFKRPTLIVRPTSQIAFRIIPIWSRSAEEGDRAFKVGQGFVVQCRNRTWRSQTDLPDEGIGSDNQAPRPFPLRGFHRQGLKFG